MSAAASKLGIVVALEREVGSFTDGWQETFAVSGGTHWKLRQSANAVVVFVGTGYRRAYAGTKVLIESARPEVVTSVGFAGAAIANMNVGDVFLPGEVLRYSNGQRFRTECGCGLLTTMDEVATPEAKYELATGLGAKAVDMEAAGVAQASQEAGRRFLALKAISDAHCDDLRLVTRFVQPEGFQTGRFIAHIAVRPYLWASVGRLARNSAIACKALTSALAGIMSDVDGFIERNNSIGILQ